MRSFSRSRLRGSRSDWSPCLGDSDSSRLLSVGGLTARGAAGWRDSIGLLGSRGPGDCRVDSRRRIASSLLVAIDQPPQATSELLCRSSASGDSDFKLLYESRATFLQLARKEIFPLKGDTY